MESTGVIKKILPAKTGTSTKTGNTWLVQPFILEVRSGEHGQYTRNQLFEVFGEDRVKQFQLFEGKSVKVMFDLEAREVDGKWFNSTRVFDMKDVMPQQHSPQYRQQPPQPQNGYFQPVQPQNGYFQPVQLGYPQQRTDPVTGEPLPF